MQALIAAAAAALLVVPAGAQSLSGHALVQALQKGGYVIVMRHASSPLQPPEKSAANPDNPKPERQLDAEGRSSAMALGEAIHRLKIPIGQVYTSPTYRALETVKYAQLGMPLPVPELGDNGQSMQGGTEAQAKWLRQKITEFKPGANTILVTHFPNIRGAFPDLGAVADGEWLVFGPDGKAGAALVGRIKIGDWPGL